MFMCLLKYFVFNILIKMFEIFFFSKFDGRVHCLSLF